MNLQVLMEKYSNDPRLQQIADRVAMPEPQRLFLSQLYGSSSAFVIASILKHPSSKSFNHLVIVEDAEEAAYLHNTIENITQSLNLFYFPSSFKNNKNFQQLNSSHITLRTEMLINFSSPSKAEGKIAITYAEVVFEKVAAPNQLNTNTINIKTGDTLDVDNVLEKFIIYGFARTDFVYEPGQFAVRGGILDIYSFGNDKPYRIELFGNEVDSIRIFDPETQLSERKLLQINIIPNIETQFDATEKISLLEYLPSNTIIWMKDANIIYEKIKTQEKELENFLATPQKIATQTEEEDNLKINVTKDDFITAEIVWQQLQHKHLIEFGHKASFSGIEIPFHTKEQPAFNRNFNLLMNDLKQWEQKGFDAFIFSDNPKQLERLHTIFEDLQAEVRFTPIPTAIHSGFIDEDLKIVCYTDHQIFQRYHKYKIKQAYNKNKAITLKALRDLQPGDYVTHIDHGVGVYSGLQKIDVNGHQQEAIRILYKDNDILYVNINALHKISKYTGKEGTVPKVSKIGSDAWQKLKEKTKAKVKEIAFDLISLYAKRKAQQGFQHIPDNYLQTELEASFIYEDTPDQSTATADVKKDMESASPMDRLVCGDVGFGKTEVAIRAAFKTCCNSKQAAVLVPTTILAFQHYRTFSERLKDFPVTVDYINRFKSAKEKKETLQKLAEGKIDIIIGTHGLLGKEVKFKDLGLLVIDEEQKFGVGAKEKLKTLKTNVDCLTLTATPIPRTLHFSLMGARDLSIINTAPPNRQPIQTELHAYNEDLIRDAIYFEVERGGQVFFIHNRVQGLPEMAGLIQGLCPDVSVGFAHGQLEGHELEKHILDFIDRKYDVLVCTNIVESGVDIPSVNTIIVNNAHQFGLSDLHQLRGRVGRSNKKAFCYLLAPSITTLPTDSRKRLQTLEQHSDLGSGFQIAMRDLDIRGAGNLLGGEQSGFMMGMGFETYQKILEESVRELKRTAFKELFTEEIQQQDEFVADCTIDTDLEILIPDTYVENITERLSLYNRLDNCANEEDLKTLHNEMQDRFGSIPPQVEDLFLTVRIRKIAIQLGFERLVLKDKILKCYFISKPDSPFFESAIFQNILQYIQTALRNAQLKQTGKFCILTVDDMNDMEQLHQFLQKMSNTISLKK